MTLDRRVRGPLEQIQEGLASDNPVAPCSTVTISFLITRRGATPKSATVRGDTYTYSAMYMEKLFHARSSIEVTDLNHHYPEIRRLDCI